jgi:hypothetical protein
VWKRERHKGCPNLRLKKVLEVLVLAINPMFDRPR